MVTTWPAFAEAMHLLGRAGGWHSQDKLWALFDSEHLQIAELPPALHDRMRKLMAKYQTCRWTWPTRRWSRSRKKEGCGTFSRSIRPDFRVYRFKGRQSFRLWPELS